MDDDELEKLKEEKMGQLQDSEQADQANAEDRLEQRRQQIRQKAAKYLTSEAKSRLGNIRAAQPDLAASIEMQIVRLGDANQLNGKVDDNKLKQILKGIQNEKEQNQTDIKFRR
jgi:programmed cell death protein 5